MYKDGKWANAILEQQKADGAWGYFHTLSEPGKQPITTEQAIRRLSIFGFTIDDEPIQRVVVYMEDCLTGRKQLPDRREKLHDWDIFTSLMLSAWIRRFTSDCPAANAVAVQWAGCVTGGFASGAYAQADYEAAYAAAFGMKPAGGRLIDFVSFYQVSLLADGLDKAAERLVADYILHHKSGIYYVYDKPLATPPAFASKAASRYLSALELLAAYRESTDLLSFAARWLENNQNENGAWDMSAAANDSICFPLSDSWRSKAVREADCTYRIQKLLAQIKRFS